MITEILEEVTKVAQWYKDLPKDYSNIQDLMYARKKLSTYQYFMSVELGNLRQSWKECEVGTEIVRREKAVECIVEGMPMTKVQEISKCEALLMFEAEKIADSMYHRMKFTIHATEEINNTMMQHVSQLKIEQKNITTQT
tara:strand:+ start:3932 stop:4351 length:420 start_codon:yes stop_codon:yes gene_type:complete